MQKKESVRKKSLSGPAQTLCLVLMAMIVSCSNTGTAPTVQDLDGIVIQGYLYAGQAVNDIRLVHLSKIIYDTTVLIPVASSPGDSVDSVELRFRDSTYNNAVVTITTNGTVYPLTSQDSGWYADVSGKLSIAVGQTYRIDVSASGRKAWAQTTVPSPIKGISVSRDTIYVAARATFTGGTGGRGTTGTDTTTAATALADSLTNLSIRWNNPSASYLYYRCFLDTVIGRGGNFARNGNYTTADSVQVSSSRAGNVARGIQTNQVTTVISLTQTGPYKVLVYSTTSDYQAMLSTMADTTNQDQWSESPTNVTNGFGFFTSFSMDSAFFNLATASGN